MQHIKSMNNPQVKDWRKLKNRKERTRTNQYVIEGFHLIEEAIIHQKSEINKIIIREDLLDDGVLENELEDIAKDRLVVVTKEIADSISETETNQGIFAEMNKMEYSFLDQVTGPILLLDAVQDPGNVGTMIRTADAAGFQAVVLGKGTVDLYNDKTLRAAQGSHFHLKIWQDDLVKYIEKLKEKEVPVLGTALDQEAKSYKDIQANDLFALIVGNEGTGISDEIIDLVDQNIFIPMKGQAESLNVAIAASILMFHLH